MPAQARDELLDEISRSKGSNPVISSNIPLRQNGLPYSGRREPEDSGVAVYFTRKQQQICIACDTFDKAWKNMRAIGLSIRDMRGPESRGCASITDQAFGGFTALPPPDAMTPPPPDRVSWRSVFGFADNTSITAEMIQSAWKAKVRTAHGDDLKQINMARDQGKVVYMRGLMNDDGQIAGSGYMRADG